MIFYKSKQDKELIKLLKHSGSDFDFDPATVKYRLLHSISSADQKAVRHFRFTRVIQYSVTFASVVVVVSTTIAFASNSKPGDKLFALNKFGEQVILNLPIGVEQKAKVQEYIVTNRMESLESVHEAQKLQSVKESDESISNAIDAITETKKRLESSGKTKQAERLEAVLDQIQAKAEEQEARLKKLEDNTKDEQARSQIRTHREKIQQSRKKAQSNIKRYNQE